MRGVFLKALVLLLLTSGSPAWAASVGWQFTGSVNLLTADDGTALGDTFELAMPFSGSVSWHTQLTDVALEPGLGLYWPEAGLSTIDLTLEIAGEVFSTSLASDVFLGVVDQQQVSVAASSGIDSTLPAGGGAGTSLLDVTGLEFGLFFGDGLGSNRPPSDLDLADFEVANIMLVAREGGRTSLLAGAVQSLTPLTLPEPGTGAALALGLGLACWSGRRRVIAAG